MHFCACMPIYIINFKKFRSVEMFKSLLMYLCMLSADEKLPKICNEQNYLNALYLSFRYVICAAVLRNTQEVMINYS